MADSRQDSKVLITARSSLFTDDIVHCYVDPDQTLADILGPECDKECVYVEINGEPLPEAEWDTRIVSTGDSVAIVGMPQGESGRSVIRTVVPLVAGVVATIYGGPLVGALVAAGATWLVYRIIPPQFDEPDDFLRRPTLTGAQNRKNPFGVIPRLYGHFRFYPILPMQADPFIEIRGNEQYLRVAMVLGYGPLEIGGRIVGRPFDSVISGSAANLPSNWDPSSLLIGDTSVDNFEEIEFEIGRPDQMSLYTNAATEEVVGIEMNNSGADVIRTLPTTGQTASLNFIWPQGIYRINSSGGTGGTIVRFRVFWRPQGQTEWNNLLRSDIDSGFVSFQNVTIQGGDHFQFEAGNNRRETYFASVTLDISQFEDPIDVRVDRLTSQGSSNRIRDMTWMTLTVLGRGRNWTVPDTVVLNMRARASGQLSSRLDNVSVEARSVLPVFTGDYDGNDEPIFTEEVTSNPAWAALDVLTGVPSLNPIDPATEVNLEDFLEWAEWCDGRELFFNHVFDNEQTAFQAFQSIAAIGRASLSFRNGLFTVVRDFETRTPVQVITPRNAREFGGQKVLEEPPHAYRVQFVDQNVWDVSERLVFDDGFNESNATNIELVQTTGITSPEEAFKYGRFRLAEHRLRPEVFTYTQGFENIVYQRGDWVRLAYDTILVGSGWGRIVETITDGVGNVTGIVTDEEILLEAGQTYAVRVRAEDMSLPVTTISTAAGRYYQVSFADPLPPIVQAGDLFLYGIVGQESLVGVVAQVEPNEDLEAQVTVVPAAPAIYDADTGPIPPYDPLITAPTNPRRIPLSIPVITSVTSANAGHQNADGSPVIKFVVSYRFPPGQQGVDIEMRYRAVNFESEEDSGEFIDGAWNYERVPSSAGKIAIIEVEKEVQYQIQLRAVDDENSRFSLWSDPVVHGVQGKTFPPANVQNFSATVLPYGIRLSWDDVPDDDRRDYEIRVHP